MDEGGVSSLRRGDPAESVRGGVGHQIKARHEPRRRTYGNYRIKSTGALVMRALFVAGLIASSMISTAWAVKGDMFKDNRAVPVVLEKSCWIDLSASHLNSESQHRNQRYECEVLHLARAETERDFHFALSAAIPCRHSFARL